MLSAADNMLTAASRWRSGAAASLERDPRWIFCVVAFAAAFWGLRGYYWSITDEQPFSDMADYIEVGRQIRTRFFFGVREPLYAYFTPVTPSLIAISMLLGGDHFLKVFRILIQGIAFIGTLLLAREIAIQTGRRWLGVLLMVVVALSRPSIFWSYKPSTEQPSEAFLLLSMGLLLLTYRTRSFLAAGAAGVSCMLLALNRPQFLLAVLLAAGVLLLSGATARRRGVENAEPAGQARGGLHIAFIRIETARLIQVMCFVLGIAVIWGPWVTRNYLHHRALIPTGTSTMDSVLFDYAGAPIRAGRYTELPLEGGEVLRHFDYNWIRTAIYATMNDHQAFLVERAIASAWLRANWMDYPRLVLWRLKNLVTERGPSGLTRVSREELFPAEMRGWNYPFTRKSWLDLILIDKTPWLVFLAIGGVAVLIRRLGWAGLLVGSLATIPWFNVALVFGLERAVESMASITCWLALYFVVEVLRPSLPRDRWGANSGATAASP